MKQIRTKKRLWVSEWCGGVSKQRKNVSYYKQVTQTSPKIADFSIPKCFFYPMRIRFVKCVGRFILVIGKVYILNGHVEEKRKGKVTEKRMNMTLEEY